MSGSHVSLKGIPIYYDSLAIGIGVDSALSVGTGFRLVQVVVYEVGVNLIIWFVHDNGCETQSIDVTVVSALPETASSDAIRIADVGNFIFYVGCNVSVTDRP